MICPQKALSAIGTLNLILCINNDGTDGSPQGSGVDAMKCVALRGNDPTKQRCTAIIALLFVRCIGFSAWRWEWLRRWRLSKFIIRTVRRHVVMSRSQDRCNPSGPPGGLPPPPPPPPCEKTPWSGFRFAWAKNTPLMQKTLPPTHDKSTSCTPCKNHPGVFSA